MKLPALSRFLFPRPSAAPPAAWCLDGFRGALQASAWSRAPLIVARSRCRLRWFRLQGLPAPERLAALRLQVEGWRPFERTDARLAIAGELGLAVAWDAAALERDLQAAGADAGRFQVLPETFFAAKPADGLRLVQDVEGHEAQHWVDGWLAASRWWPHALTETDWAEFVRASGASREDGRMALPAAEPAVTGQPWVRSHALQSSDDHARGAEQRLVFLGGVALTLAAGVMVHQWWDASREARRLTAQIGSLKAAASPVIAARDGTLAQVADIDKLAAWMAVPQPVDVIAHLNDTLGRSNVQIKELELERDKLRLSLQLGATTGRAVVVRELQAGGWFTDVTEARADNARGLLTMDMRIRGALPPVARDGAESPAPGPAGTTAAAAAPAPQAAPAAVPAPAPAPAARPAALPPPPPGVQAPGPRPPPGPSKPIIAKPDENGLPPASVFDAIPSR